MPAFLATDVVAALAARLDELARAIFAERDAAADEQWEEGGVVSMRLDPADPGYAPLVRQPLLFSAADTVIGPGCRVDGLGLRAPGSCSSGYRGGDPDAVAAVREFHPRLADAAHDDARIWRNEYFIRAHIYAQTGILNHVPLTLPDDCRAAFSIVLVGNQIADLARPMSSVMIDVGARRSACSAVERVARRASGRDLPRLVARHLAGHAA